MGLQSQSRNLAEKYRPTRLENMVGQGRALRALRRIIDEGYMSGGFVFEGPTGTGKTTAALALVDELGADRHWDFVKVPAKGCTVDAVRKIAAGARFAPVGKGGYRVWLVDEAHTMQKDAVEAWKNVLEDLPARRVVIFATTDGNRLGAAGQGSLFATDTALRDRCTRIRFEAASDDEVEALVKVVAEREEIVGVDPAAVVRAAGGSFRRALRALQDAATGNLVGEVDGADSPVAPIDPDEAGRCRACGAPSVHARGLCRRCYHASRSGRPTVAAAVAIQA